MNHSFEDFVVCTGEKIQDGIHLLSFQSLTREQTFYNLKLTLESKTLTPLVFMPHQPQVFIVDFSPEGWIQHLYYGYTSYQNYLSGEKSPRFHKRVRSNRTKVLYGIAISLIVVLILCSLICFSLFAY